MVGTVLSKVGISTNPPLQQKLCAIREEKRGEESWYPHFLDENYASDVVLSRVRVFSV